MFSAQKFLVITKKFVNPVNFLSSQAYKAVSFDVLSNEFSGTAVIALNSPQNKNGLSKLLVSEINQILDEIELNNSIRVLLVRSLVPGIFCAGADLKERAKMPLNEVPVTVCGLRRLMARLYNFQVPVLAAIDGVAFGGGLEMALGCDIRIAASDSKMGLVETRLAIIPGAGGTQYLPRIINPSLAKELIYTARVLSADEAKENGIVNHVVIQNDTKDAAYKKALDVAKEILPNGPVAVKMAKKAINKGLEVGLETGFAIEEACYSQILHTNDRLEGLAAFNEKRRPKYKGE